MFQLAAKYVKRKVIHRLQLSLSFQETPQNKLEILLIPNFNFSEKIEKAVTK